MNKLLSSEYLAYLDKIDFMIIVINKDENIHFINETACKITGYERDELKGKNYFNNLIPENIRYEIREVFRSIISNRISFLEEGFNPIIAKDGTIKNILWSNKILKNNKGEITGTLSTGKLIAEQESYEYANMNIVSQLLSILNSIDQAIYVADFDTYEILYANPVIQRLFNDQLIGKKCHKVLQNIDEPCSFCTNDLLRKNKNEPYIWEWQNLKLKKDYLCIDRAIKWANNKDVRFELAIDITRNKQIERDLARKLNYEKALSDISNLLTISLLKKESITEALSILISSFNACRGYVFENIESPDKGLCMQQIHYTYNEKKIKKKINNPVRQEIPYHPDLSRIRKELENNKAILSKINEMKKPEVDALQANDTKVIYIIPIRAFDKWYGFARIDICDQEVELTEEEKNLLVTAVNIIGNYIERKISVNALKDEKERLSITLRSIGDGVIALNEKACITLLNKAAESLTGWKEKDAIGKNLVDVFNILNDKTRNPIDHPVKNIIESDQIINLSNSILVSKDGSERYISYTYAPIKNNNNKVIGVILIFKDITDKLKIDIEMQKIDKLESIGLLAGGIAHDFNNFLMAIWGNIDIAKASIDNKETVLHRLFESEKALAKAEELTNQLLTFSKGGIPIKKKLLSNNFIKEAIDFVLHGSKVKSFYEFKQTYQTLVDESQLSRVLSNIALNAVEAMDEGGILNIAVDNFDVTNQIEIPLEEGKYVKISIKDNGTGISEKHLSRIFDPYFTTKAKGSGLGLAVAFSIIKYHNGYLKVESKKGAGSTFSIYMPASLDTKEIVEKSDSLDSSNERILVMDDDDMVRDVLGIMIKTIGYDVDFAIDGEEALKKVEKAFYENKGYCLIIMDLTIPGGMGGKEAVTLVKKNYPSIKVIVSSGYSKDPVMADFRKYGFDGMLAKPFNHNMLENALNEILSKKRDQPR